MEREPADRRKEIIPGRVRLPLLGGIALSTARSLQLYGFFEHWTMSTVLILAAVLGLRNRAGPW
jgi:hypothetical protein